MNVFNAAGTAYYNDNQEARFAPHSDAVVEISVFAVMPFAFYSDHFAFNLGSGLGGPMMPC